MCDSKIEFFCLPDDANNTICRGCVRRVTHPYNKDGHDIKRLATFNPKWSDNSESWSCIYEYNESIVTPDC
jgi:hypothetical protein